MQPLFFSGQIKILATRDIFQMDLVLIATLLLHQHFDQQYFAQQDEYHHTLHCRSIEDDFTVICYLPPRASLEFL